MIAKNLKTYPFKKRLVTIDDEANTIVSYDNENVFEANIYPSSGTVQAQQYGLKLGYVLNCITHDLRLNEKDLVIVDNMEYEVISIKKYSEHLQLELMKK